jgi:signal transduction histidine kinase
VSGAFLLRRIVKFDPSLSRLRDAIGLIALGAFGSAVVSSSIGVFVLYAAHVQAYSGFGSAWLIYWLGDSTGVLLVTPLVLSFPALLGIRPRARFAEFAALLLLLTAVCFIIFGDLPPIPVRLHVLAFAVLPFVMWAAIRFGVVGATLSNLVVAIVATVATAFGFGPFALHAPFVNAVLLDVFFAVLSVSGLTLAVVIAELQQVETEREQLIRDQATIVAQREALSNVSRKLIEAQEQERIRIARELHDDMSQRLAMLTVAIEQLKDELPPQTPLFYRIDELRERTSELATDVQSLSHELHSSKLEYLGLVAAAKGFCREFSEQQKVEIDFETHDLLSPLPRDISLGLFRVLQEALHNSAKHSGIRHFDVRLWGTTGEIHLTVQDCGVGFDSETAKLSRGIGLISMEERVKALNGAFSIQSEPNRGTTVYARLPFSLENNSLRAAG